MSVAGKTILLVDDEKVLRESLAELLADEGAEPLQAADGRIAHRVLLERSVDLVLTDIRMPEVDGITLLGHLKQLAPETPAIVLTAYGTVQNAVEAMRLGAFDYLLKPVNFDDVLIKVQRALQIGALAQSHQFITEQVAHTCSFHHLVGDSAPMVKLFEIVRKLAVVKSSVLIVGESGTGKELFARAIHYNGVTRNKPFVPVNCGAIPESLIESELFGHRRGSFTGAVRDKVGYFEAAHGGTLFLDEISTLPLNVQGSLLRTLEERVVVPVGDTKPRAVDLRVIAASNRDLENMVATGEFREDLLYRLNVVKLELPPLRNRREDIPSLVHHFVCKYAREMNKPVEQLTNGAMRALLDHRWPGNVRELENVIERAIIFTEDQLIRLEDLPFAAHGLTDDVGEDLKEAVRYFERHHILESLKRHQYDKTETANCLGIGVSSLYRKLDELEIPKRQDESAPPGDGI